MSVHLPQANSEKPWLTPKLRGAELELTTRCPCRCITCGSNAGRERTDELSQDEWLGVIDELAQMGCKHVTLLGGEPLVFPGWSDLVRRCRSREMNVEVVTSGVTVTESVAKLTRASGLTSITVSVDGTRAAHDKQRGIRDGFDRALRAIELLDGAGLHVGVTTQLNRLSVPTLEDLAPQIQQAGALGWQVQLTFPTGRGKGCGIELRPDEMPNLLATLRRLRRRHGLQPALTDAVGYGCWDDTLLRTHPGRRARPWIQCFAGLRHVGIGSQGQVKGCLALPDDYIEGSVRTAGLRAVWEDNERFAYTRRFDQGQLGGGCATCHQGDFCRGGCTAASVAFHGVPGRSDHCFSLFEPPVGSKRKAPSARGLRKDPS